MTRMLTMLAATLVLALALAACGGGEPYGTREGPGGRLLVNERGLTLYAYERDTPGRSTCNNLCAQDWPPFAAPADARPKGKWTIIARDDRLRQWSYDGKPLYTRTTDKRPGETTGAGIDELWRIARP